MVKKKKIRQKQKRERKTFQIDFHQSRFSLFTFRFLIFILFLCHVSCYLKYHLLLNQTFALPMAQKATAKTKLMFLSKVHQMILRSDGRHDGKKQIKVERKKRIFRKMNSIKMDKCKDAHKR